MNPRGPVVLGVLGNVLVLTACALATGAGALAQHEHLSTTAGTRLRTRVPWTVVFGALLIGLALR